MSSNSNDAVSVDGLRVLFLEDEALVFMNHVEMLQGLGCIVTGCMTIPEALTAIQKGTYDLGLLDVNIDGEMSYEVAEALHERGIPVAFITGYQSAALEEKWRDHPSCEKPCAAEDFHALIVQAFGMRK